MGKREYRNLETREYDSRFGKRFTAEELYSSEYVLPKVGRTVALYENVVCTTMSKADYITSWYKPAATYQGEDGEPKTYVIRALLMKTADPFSNMNEVELVRHRKDQSEEVRHVKVRDILSGYIMLIDTDWWVHAHLNEPLPKQIPSGYSQRKGSHSKAAMRQEMAGAMDEDEEETGDDPDPITLDNLLSGLR